MSAAVIAFPVKPRRVCQAYLDRTHNATVIPLPVGEIKVIGLDHGIEHRYRYDFATWRRVRVDPRERT